MGDVVAMNVLDPIDNLLEIELGLLLGDLLALNVVKEFAIVGQLHDYENIIVGVEHFVQFDDVGVVNEL